MSEYSLCPQCGSSEVIQTFVDYMGGRDENEATCACGWVGEVWQLQSVFNPENKRRFFDWLRTTLEAESAKMDILNVLKKLGGYWKYAGGQYLAKLTSGKVSDTYVNCSVLTSSPRDLADAVRLGRHKLHEHDSRVIPGPFCVCGPAMGGITLAYEVAQCSGGTAIFTEPIYLPESISVPTGGGDLKIELHVDKFAEQLGIDSAKALDRVNFRRLVLAIDKELREKTYRQVIKCGQELKRFTIPVDATVLFVEDVITIGKSTEEMIRAAMTCPSAFEWGYGDGAPLPYVLCLINRSGMKEIVVTDDYDTERRFQIIALAEITAKTWDTVEDAEKEILGMTYGPNGNAWYKGDILGNFDKWRIGPRVPHMKALRPKEHWAKLVGERVSAAEALCSCNRCGKRLKAGKEHLICARCTQEIHGR